MFCDDFADAFKRVFELQGTIDSSVVNLRSQDARDGAGTVDAPLLRQFVDLLNQIGGDRDGNARIIFRASRSARPTLHLLDSLRFVR